MGALQPVEEFTEPAQSPLPDNTRSTSSSWSASTNCAWVMASPSNRRDHKASLLRCLPLLVTAARTSATTNCECPVSASAARTTSATRQAAIRRS